MRYLFLILFSFLLGSISAQIRVDQLTEIDTLAATDAFYTAERGQFQKVTIATLDAYFSGGNSVPTLDTLTSTGTTMEVRYFGTTAPVLANTAAGKYTLTLTAGTAINGFTWVGDNTTLTGSNTIELTIIDAVDVYSIFQVYGEAAGQLFGALSGIVPVQTNATPGEVKTVFPNMSNFGVTGFKIVAKSL